MFYYTLLKLKSLFNKMPFSGELTFTNFHGASRLILAQARGNEMKWLNFLRFYSFDIRRQH